MSDTSVHAKFQSYTFSIFSENGCQIVFKLLVISIMKKLLSGKSGLL